MIEFFLLYFVSLQHARFGRVVYYIGLCIISPGLMGR